MAEYQSGKFRSSPRFPLLHAKEKHGDFSFAAVWTWRQIRVFALRSNSNRKTPAWGKNWAWRDTVNRFWGQALQKRACRIQKDSVLCLHPLPVFTLFHSFKNVPVCVVPQSGTPKYCPKPKGVFLTSPHKKFTPLSQLLLSCLLFLPYNNRKICQKREAV